MAERKEVLTAEQQRFLTNYLGVSPQVPGAGGQAGKTLPIWIDAREATGQQIGALQSRMQAERLPLFRKIADAGLNGVTDGQLNKLQAALMDFDRASGPALEAAAANARKATEAMRNFLASDPVVALLERNPFGVPVNVRDPLGTALDRIDRILAGI